MTRRRRRESHITSLLHKIKISERAISFNHGCKQMGAITFSKANRTGSALKIKTYLHVFRHELDIWGSKEVFLKRIKKLSRKNKWDLSTRDIKNDFLPYWCCFEPNSLSGVQLERYYFGNDTPESIENGHDKQYGIVATKTIDNKDKDAIQDYLYGWKTTTTLPGAEYASNKNKKKKMTIQIYSTDAGLVHSPIPLPSKYDTNYNLDGPNYFSNNQCGSLNSI